MNKNAIEISKLETDKAKNPVRFDIQDKFDMFRPLDEVKDNVDISMDLVPVS